MSGDEGGRRLVVSLPWYIPEWGSKYGEPRYGGPAASPAGWPPRVSPVPGENLAALLGRTIADPFLQFVTSRTVGGALPSLNGRHPAELTFQWWNDRWPDRTDFAPPEYHRDRVYWRLLAALFGQLRARDFVARFPHPDDPYLLQDVESEWWGHIHMALRFAHDGWRLCPEPWHGTAPPPGLPCFHALRLWPAPAPSQAHPAAEAAAEPTTQPPPPAAVVEPRAPGRPSGTPLLYAELARRKEAGEVLGTQAAEAKALRAWLINAHPKQRAPDALTIENVLRVELRQAVADAKAKKPRNHPTK